MRLYVETAAATFAVDLESEEVEQVDVEVERAAPLALNLPRVVASASTGATVLALVDAKPPLLLSRDAGATWTAAGRGLPPGFAVAIAERDPDTMAYAGRDRVYLSRDGGVFWAALPLELPEIQALELD